MRWPHENGPGRIPRRVCIRFPGSGIPASHRPGRRLWGKHTRWRELIGASGKGPRNYEPVGDDPQTFLVAFAEP